MTGIRYRAARHAGLLAFLLAATVPFVADATELPLCERPPVSHWLSNPAGDREARLAALAEREARWDSTLSRGELRGLGSLYWLGERHPARLVARDIDKGRRYFNAAALRGDLPAMASSAELELADGDPLTGMLWAQTLVVYTRAWKREGEGNEPYQADLIRRAYDKLPRNRVSDEQLDRLLTDFITRHRAGIEAGEAEASVAAPAPDAADGGATGEAPACRPLHEAYPLVRVPAKLRIASGRAANKVATRPGWGLFHILVNPAGEVVDAYVVESLPGADNGVGYLATIRRLRFNAVDPSAPLREASVPMSLVIPGIGFRD